MFFFLLNNPYKGVFHMLYQRKKVKVDNIFNMVDLLSLLCKNRRHYNFCILLILK